VQGLPKIWMHQGDELYANLRGPGKNMTVLATAYSDPANHGTGFDEPQLLVLRYGKGRIFHTTFGHDGDALSSVDTVVTLQRGVEWAATGKVTQRVPASFRPRILSATAPTSQLWIPMHRKGRTLWILHCLRRRREERLRLRHLLTRRSHHLHKREAVDIRCC